MGVRSDVGVQRLYREHHVVGVQHVVGVELVWREDVHTGKVAHALGAGLITTPDDHQHLLVVGQRGQETPGALGRRSLTRHQFGDRVDTAVAGPVRQRATQRGGDHLLRGALAVVARLRTVHDTTAGELWRTRRTLTRAASALLPVRLTATTANLAAGLGRVRALASRGQLGRDD